MIVLIMQRKIEIIIVKLVIKVMVHVQICEELTTQNQLKTGQKEYIDDILL